MKTILFRLITLSVATLALNILGTGHANARELFTSNSPAIDPKSTNEFSATASASYDSGFVNYKAKKGLVSISNRSAFYKVGNKTIFRSVDSQGNLFLYDISPKAGSRDFIQFVNGNNQNSEVLSVSFPTAGFFPLFLSNASGRNLEGSTSLAGAINYRPTDNILLTAGYKKDVYARVGFAFGSVAASIATDGDLTAAASLNKELSIGYQTKNSDIVGQWRFGSGTSAEAKYSINNGGISFGVNQTI